MTIKRKSGEKSENVLSKFDLMILKVLNESKDDVGILELARRLSIGHRGIKRHIIRLNDYGLITKNPTGKNKMIVLKITDNGKLILKIFKI
ncbi:MAG: hypothetical protein WC781_03420 [Candidatus Pacearchaeota archaeon]|jgi:predicted transcriptional regulator